jgi:hypothetical protein
MVDFKKALEGILETGKRRVSSSRKKKDPVRESVRIFSLSKQSEVPTILKFARVSPVIFLYIKDYRDKNNESLKKSLFKLKDEGEADGVQSKLLDENWVVVMARNTSLAR